MEDLLTAWADALERHDQERYLGMKRTLSNCGGGVLGCVRGLSPAFNGGSSPGWDRLQVLAERR
jgi:hypothetical protein